MKTKCYRLTDEKVIQLMIKHCGDEQCARSFEALPEEKKMQLVKYARKFVGQLNGLGWGGALELLYKLGLFLAKCDREEIIAYVNSYN